MKKKSPQSKTRLKSKKSKSKSKSNSNSKVSTKQKLYCGSMTMLPNSDYLRRGTPQECLNIGIGVGRRLEFEELKQYLKRNKQISIRRRPRKKG